MRSFAHLREVVKDKMVRVGVKVAERALEWVELDIVIERVAEVDWRGGYLEVIHQKGPKVAGVLQEIRKSSLRCLNRYLPTPG